MTIDLTDEAQAALERLTTGRPSLTANELINQLLVLAAGALDRSESVERAFVDGEIRWTQVLKRLSTD